MKIQFFGRRDGSSLDYVGQSIYKCIKQYNNTNPISFKTSNKYVEGEKTNRADIGISYGLFRDIHHLNAKYNIRIAGLVCEDDLTDKEAEYIKGFNLTEIWLPSQFCVKKFQAKGINNLALIPHGVWNMPIIKKKEKPTNKFLMIFNSYPNYNFHVQRKSVLEAIKAFSHLPDCELHLRTTKQSYYNDLPSNVKFIEHRVDKLSDIYDDFDCILCPSKSEGFGLIGLDALASGMPIISTKTGNDYLTDEVSYMHVELPLMPIHIIKAIREFQRNFDYYVSLSLNQAPIITEKWHWLKISQSIQKRLNALYQNHYR